MKALLEKIVGRQKERERARVTSYRDMVAEIATGKEVNPDDVDRLLTVTGKSLDELTESVWLYQRRLELRAQIDRLPEIERERDKVRKQIAEAYAVLALAEKKHEEVTSPLRGRADFLKQQASEATNAGTTLIDTCPTKSCGPSLPP